MDFLFANAVKQILNGTEPCLYVVDLDKVTDREQTTFRDLLRAAFFEEGVEIEFSGKGINERGVVIDLDEERLTQAGYSTDAWRFGQTIVRVRR